MASVALSNVCFSLSFPTNKTLINTTLSVSIPIPRSPPLHPITATRKLPNQLSSAPPYIPTSTPSPNEINTTNDLDQQIQPNAISQFLLKECGLSPSQLKKILTIKPVIFRTKSTQRAREAVEVLKDSGFTQKQLTNTILRNPSILSLKVEGQLKPKIQYMESLGLSGPRLGRVISEHPRFLNLSFDNKIQAQSEYLENLFGSKVNLARALLRAPNILVTDVEKQLKPKLEILKQYGIRGKLVSHLVSKCPGVLSSNSTESLKLKIEYVQKMGILEGTKTFAYALLVVTCNGPENLEKKLKHMTSFGLSDVNVTEIVNKSPKLLTLSTNKMQKNMDFLTQVVGFPFSIVLKYPALLGYSVEKRLMPRHEVYKALSSMEHDKHLPTLTRIFYMQEKAFIQKCVENRPKAEMLYTMYKGQSSDVSISEYLNKNNGN